MFCLLGSDTEQHFDVKARNHGLAPVDAGSRHAASIISYVTRPKRRASAYPRFSIA